MSPEPSALLRRTASSVVETARRRTPESALPFVVGARSRLAWAVPAVRREARRQMTFLLGTTSPPAEVDRVARRYVREMARRSEVRWHPRVATAVRVEGIEHARVALEPGRGAILSFMHHGLYDRVFTTLSRQGLSLAMVVYPYMLHDDAPGWIRQHVRVNTLGGGRAVSTEVGAAGLAALLREGHMLAIASDVPGRTPVTFAGRDVLGSFGAARLAVETGAPVVVMTSDRDDRGEHVRLHRPLEPATFASAHALLERILLAHERAVLSWPEASDLPLSRWGTSQPQVRAQ